MNRYLVGSTYGRFCIKFPQSRMKGERHRLSSVLSLQFSSLRVRIYKVFTLRSSPNFSASCSQSWQEQSYKLLCQLQPILVGIVLQTSLPVVVNFGRNSPTNFSASCSQFWQEQSYKLLCQLQPILVGIVLQSLCFCSDQRSKMTTTTETRNPQIVIQLYLSRFPFSKHTLFKTCNFKKICTSGLSQRIMIPCIRYCF